MIDNELIQELDKALEQEKERFDELREKRYELSKFMKMSSHTEKAIEDITERYEGNKESYEQIDEHITNEIFGPIVRLVLRPIYVGKSITNIGSISVRFYSKTLRKVISIDL